MKRTFLDFEKTANLTAAPSTGESRMLVNNSGVPVLRNEAGSDTDFSMEGHAHTDYAPVGHNHDGVYSIVGHSHPKSVVDLGNAVTALSLDLDGEYFQEVTFTGDTSMTVINSETGVSKEINLHLTTNIVSVLTFPATWRWESKPVGDQITINPGEEYYVKIISRGNAILARYSLLET